MSKPIKILGLAGSARKDSLHKKLVKAALAVASTHADSVTWVDLKDYDIPLYDGDLETEQGQPAAALRLRALFKEHDALLIGSPEYNGFPSPLLKNTLDWLSRPLDGEERHAAFRNKPTLLLATSRGESGGVRGLQSLRQLLNNLKALLHTADYSLPNGAQAFDVHGNLVQDKDQIRLEHLVKEFVLFARTPDISTVGQVREQKAA